MRDPARINPTLSAIAEIWERHPDLRLGQLLSAAADYARNGRRGPDLFQMEDGELLRGLEILAAEMERGR